jgi:hypothetical protein
MYAIRSSKIAVPILAVTLALGLSCSFAADRTQAALKSQAKISEAQATQAALAQVPNGIVTSSELEREHGKLVWSFDLTQASAPGTTEVQIDAITGKVVSVRKESAAEEAKEKSAEAIGKEETGK